MKHCRNCGRELISDNDQFCMNCGCDQRAYGEPMPPQQPMAPQQTMPPQQPEVNAAPSMGVMAPTVAPPAAQAATAQPINAKLLSVSGIALIATLLVKFLVSYLLNFLASILYSYGLVYFLALLFGLLPVAAFVLMGVAGLSLASKLKRIRANGLWALLTGVGAFLGAFAWFVTAINNGYLSSVLVQDAGLSYTDISVFLDLAYVLFLLPALAAAVLFLLAAINAKRPLAQSTLSGTVAAILLGIYVVGGFIVHRLVAPFIISTWIGSGSDISVLTFIFGVMDVFVLLPLIAFAVCQTIFLNGAAKQLRCGLRQLS